MKTKLLVLVSIFALSFLGGCDLFEEDNRCSERDIPPVRWFNVNSYSTIYKIQVNEPSVSIVTLKATYFIHRCGSDNSRAYWSTPVKIVEVKPPQSLYEALGGYSCSTEIRNYNDEVEVVLELTFENLVEQVGTKTLRLSRNGAEFAEQGKDINWIPEFSTSF